MIQVLLHCCIYMYITMPLTAILSLHKYDLLALNILHQNFVGVMFEVLRLLFETNFFTINRSFFT